MSGGGVGTGATVTTGSFEVDEVDEVGVVCTTAGPEPPR